MDAALACLVEAGYGGTTTTEVAQRAGVSRGAQLHHFPSKQELLVAAVEQVFDRRRDQFRKAFADVPVSVDPVDAAIDLLWSTFTTDAFPAWLELEVAARTDPDLHPVMVELNRRFMADNGEVFAEIFPGADPMALRFAFTLMDGLALRRLCDPDPQTESEIDEILAALKGLARLAFPAPDAD
jgi:AcrR family transcriptional regulator